MDNIAVASISLSARHRTVKHSSVYIQDAMTRFSRMQRDRFAKDCELVSQWSSIHMESMDPDALPVTPDTHLIKPLPELAHWWYTTCLGYTATGPIPKPHDLYQYAVQKQGTDDQKE
jgi:hypothetical protein